MILKNIKTGILYPMLKDSYDKLTAESKAKFTIENAEDIQETTQFVRNTIDTAEVKKKKKKPDTETNTETND